ncbi:response regulator [Chloroflexi bacterium TSY]|nr:response regulator [Chloroflexi bacterium TSY]
MYVPQNQPLILIVDADPNLCAILKQFLTPKGYDVLTVHDKQDALLYIDKDPIDLILLDLGISNMTGVDLCQAIRLWSDVPILITQS